MFAKPPSFKPFAAIKNSERKNVLGNIEQQCRIQHWEPENKQKLLPKGVQSGKGITHSGEKVLVYSESQLPLWVVVRSTFVPTVALMASLPGPLQQLILPIIYTRGQTLQFLRNGADFMVPGIVGDLPTEPVDVGCAVQIRDIQTHALLAIGIAMVDLSKINPEHDKGKCIQTINVVNDKLTPNVDIVEIGKLSLSDQGPNSDSPVNSTTNAPETINNTASEFSNDTILPSNGTDEPNAANESDLNDKTFEEIDDAFMYSLKQVIRQPSNEYPMPMASVATLLNEHLPYEHPSLAIKNTSFKKINKLLRHAEKLGLITCKVRQGGELLITGVNKAAIADPIEHPVVPQPKKQAKPDKMKVSIAYRPTPAIKQVIGADIASEYLDAATLRKCILNYVTTNKLASSNQKSVALDEPLRKALGQKQTVESVAIEDLGALALSKCTAFHRVVPLGKSDKDIPLTKGPLPTIHIKTERRGGNKVVTLVDTNGLRGFHIDPTELAEQLRHVCAGSSTITVVKGVEAIVVQGNHVKKITELLEKKGIRQSWIKS